MTRKQLVTRTEIAKMAGQDKQAFFEPRCATSAKTAW